MGSLGSEAKLPWIQTPVIASPQLSRAAGCNIYLKLENLQPSGSFKSRGIGNLTLRAAAASPSPNTHFYCSSGGNAGLACATSALALGLPATIVTPTTTPPFMIAKLKLLGARVEQVGDAWAGADAHLRENHLAHDPDGVYVPPFDHPDIWAGAATIIEELAAQMPVALDSGADLHAVVASVGGGGLVNGLLQGIDTLETDQGATAPWPRGRPPAVVAVETLGAHSLHASVQAGEHLTLPKISSIATSLGASRVSAKTWDWAERKARLGGGGKAAKCPGAVRGPGSDSEGLAVADGNDGPAELESLAVSDAEAAMACVRFADDARFVVETACGATIAPCYNGMLREALGRGLTDAEWRDKNVVLVICGGSNVTLQTLDGYREKYAAMV